MYHKYCAIIKNKESSSCIVNKVTAVNKASCSTEIFLKLSRYLSINYCIFLLPAAPYHFYSAKYIFI